MKTIGFPAEELKEVLENQETLVEDHIMFHQRLELLVNVIMNTAGDMLELCSLVVLWDVLATVSTEVMPSALDGG